MVEQLTLKQKHDLVNQYKNKTLKSAYGQVWVVGLDADGDVEMKEFEETFFLSIDDFIVLLVEDNEVVIK